MCGSTASWEFTDYGPDSLLYRFTGPNSHVSGLKIVLYVGHYIQIPEMKLTTQRNWSSNRSKSRSFFDQTTALGSVTVALFGYIVYHFIYPLISKGLLW